MKCGYIRDTWDCGETLEVEEKHTGRYGARGQKREPKKEPTPEDIIRQNQWKRVRDLRRLVKWNFTTGDSWITLTYQKDKRVSWEEMIKHMQKFIRQLQTRYRKYGWTLKYIWRPQIGKRGAIHIHILLNAESNTETRTEKIVRELWTHGNPNMKVVYDLKNGDLAEYIATPLQEWEPEKAKAYHPSRNLIRKEPDIRKQERINEMMAEVPCVPEEAERWVEDKLFPGNILFFKKEEKRTVFSCTACGYAGWRKSGWKHGEKTICPKCKALVTTNSRQEEKTAKAMVTILQQYGKKWVERQFRAVCRWTAGEKEIKLSERIRAIMPLRETWGKVWYGTIPEADEFAQEFWDKPHGKRFVPSYLYPGNLPEVLKAGGLEHSGMDILANAGMKFNVNIYIISFHNHPYLEYLAKAGLTRLAADIVNNHWAEINRSGRNDKEILKTFTKEQHRIRNEWKEKHAKVVAESISKQEMDTAMDGFKNAFLRMAGLGGD